MQKKETNRFIYHCWLITGLLTTLTALIGCATSQSGIQGNESVISDPTLTFTVTAISISQSATPTPSLTPTQTATVTSTPSMIPSPTATVIPGPSAMPIATFTLALTLTPLPTIPSQQRGQVYTELMSSNGGCALPCWWGFELGATNVDMVRQLYIALGANISERKYPDNYSVVEALFVDPQIENDTQVVHSFVTQEGIVIETLIDADDPNYQIEPLLQRLGEPADIWMWTIPEPYQGILPTRFRLYFPAKGVFVLYATGGTKVDDNVQVCFDEPGGVTLLLWNPAIWDPNGTKGIVDRANEGGTAFTLEGFPIEEVSNWDVEQFYTVLSDPAHSECLETASNLWTSP